MTPFPTKRGLARLLWRLADMVQAAERGRSFRAKAYRRAVWAIDGVPRIDADDEELMSIPGIGPGVTALIREYRASGELKQLIPLEEAYPADTPRIRLLPRMTPAMLRGLKDLGVERLDDLRLAIESGAAATLRGLGPQTLDLWDRILDLAPGPDHVPAHEAWATASTLSAHLAEHTGGWVDIAGSVRRLEEWVDRIDLVAVTEDRVRLDEFLETSAAFGSTNTGGDAIEGTTHPGIQIAIHPVLPESSGTKLLWVTGPPRHAAEVTMEPFPTEYEAYRSVGLPLIPAPARHLPLAEAVDVIEVDDLRGDFHIHTELSPDGRMTLEEVLTVCRQREYLYVAITDHTHGLRFGGLDGTAIVAQSQVISATRSLFPDLMVLHGAELNIGPDGGLDLDPEALGLLDLAVAGVHSHFGLDHGTQTERVVAALECPSVRVLAHPTGRRIGIRPPLSLDMERVIDVAVANEVALEVNGHRDRLDLSAEWIRVAAERGALFAADSDAHRASEMGNIANAVGLLQRAGVGPERVVNTWPVDRLVSWLPRRTGR
jgi:DNA polymerase (family 10)